MLPLEESRLLEVRAELDEHRSRLETTDGSKVLVIRAPGEEPDLVVDLDRAVLYVDEEDTGADDVLVVGSARATRVEPSMLERKLKARSEREDGMAARVRELLGEPYDYTLFRGGSHRDVLRLAVRVPKVYARDLAGDDLVHLRENVLLVAGTPKGEQVAVVYVLADEDRARMDAARFFADLRETGRTGVEGGDVRKVLLRRLKGQGYGVIQGLDAPGVDIAAERDDRKLLARVGGTLEADHVEACRAAAERMEADAFLCVTSDATPEARRRALGTPVEIVPPDEVADLCL